MTVPDAQTYLRCRLEDAISRINHDPLDVLRQRVRAALAIDGITEEVAEQILADAERAVGFRSGEQHFRSDDDHERDSSRTVVCPTVIRTDWGTLTITHVVFGAHDTTIAASGTTQHGSGQGWRPHGNEPWQQIEVVDGAGTTHHAHFSGGSSGGSFHGEFTVHSALTPEAGAITVAGHHVDLTDLPVPPPVRVDALPELSTIGRARRHLDLVRSGHRPSDNDAQTALDTFAALGLAEVDESSGPPASPRPHRRPHPHRAGSTELRLVPIGVTSPVVDGLVITLTTLTAAGLLSVAGRSCARVAEDGYQQLLGLSALDNLGGRYSCDIQHGSGGGTTFHHSYQLTPDPDSAARELIITIDTLRHRIHVDVALDWQDG